MRTRTRFVTALSAALLLAAPLARLAAQGWIEPLRPGAGLVRLRTAVTARVSGRVARVEVEDWFENRGGGLAEGDYYYPLPGEGAFADLSLFQGDRELKGETMDAQQARSIYEEIVRRRRDPALVELVGHGLLRARVFPIAAGEKRRVVLRYTQLLPRAGDALVFRYAVSNPGRGTAQPWPLPPQPWRGGPPPRGWLRPLPGPDSAPPDRVGAPAPAPAPADGASPIDFRLVLEDGAAFRDPFSPTHELRSERTNGQLVVRPAGELRGDLAVFLPLREAGRAAGASVVAYRTGEEDGYALISLSPGEIRGEQVPRDVALV
ncbi:MAG TPA: VIT domain-containing protein, partial [Longimicrobiales bacterium]